VYATVEELRAEGVTVGEASDERLRALIAEASSTIDRVTGWFFEPRPMQLVLSGRGTPTLVTPLPLLRINRLEVGGGVVDDVSGLLVMGAPVLPGFDEPRLTWRGGRVWPRGDGNVVVDGLWGYTEWDGTPTGRTPLPIRRACILLVLKGIRPLADVDAAQERRAAWRVLEMRTRDQSVRFAPLSQAAARREQQLSTNEPEADDLLDAYRRPAPLGAA